MAKELIINEKKYYPSVVLAERFSYTGDYLTKLARDGKVEASKVGRQWFLCEESLTNFVSAASEQKEKRKNDLREERRKERVAFAEANDLESEVENDSQAGSSTVADFEKELFVKPVASPLGVGAPQNSLALLQSLLVVICGSLMGLIGFTVYEENLSTVVLLEGTKVAVNEIGDAVFPISEYSEAIDQTAALDLSGFLDWLLMREEVLVDVAEKSDVTSGAVEPANVSPAVQQSASPSGIMLLDADVSTTTVADIKKSFSDEVEVTFDDSDTGMITPVFREKSDESYRFLLVPVKEVKN